MITHPILAEKERVQIELVEESGYDMKKYSKMVHQLFLEVQEPILRTVFWNTNSDAVRD